MDKNIIFFDVETNGKIDLNNLKSGVYMLNVEEGYSFKIIKK